MQEAREEPSMESSSPRTFRQKIPADVERTGQKRESGLDDSSGLVAIPSAVLLSASGSLGLSAKSISKPFLLAFKSPPSLSPLTQGQVDQASLRHSHHNYSVPEESITPKHHCFQNRAKH